MLFIILANVLLYGLVVAGTGEFNPSAEQLLAWGGDLGALSLHGEPWRLVTGIFLHASPGHIFGNMALLFFAGMFVEATVGSTRVLIVYLERVRL